MNSIQELFDQLNSNPWFNLLTRIGFILSMLLAVFLHLKGRETKSPRYAIRSMNIVRDLTSRIESLEMSYRGKKIETATVTKVLFWNAGRKTIHRTDVAEADPLIIRIKKGCEIFDARVTQMKNPANLFTAVLDEDSKVRIGFDFVDKNEGVVIQLVHTGRSSQDVEVAGTIKGVGKLGPRSKYTGSLARARTRYATAVLSISFGAVFLAAVLFMPKLPSAESTPSYILIAASLVSFLIGTLYSSLGIRLLLRGIPRGFDTFEMEDSR